MTRPPPIVCPIPPAVLRGEEPWSVLLARHAETPRHAVAAYAPAFEFKNDEKAFVRALLARKSNYRVFRCNQLCFCGDFVVVDMSSPSPARRPVRVVDLKQGAPLKTGGGGAGVQFRNAARAVDAVAEQTGVIASGPAFERVAGGRAEVLRYLGVPGAR